MLRAFSFIHSRESPPAAPHSINHRVTFPLCCETIRAGAQPGICPNLTQEACTIKRFIHTLLLSLTLQTGCALSAYAEAPSGKRARGIKCLEVNSPLEVTGTGTEIPIPPEEEARIAQKFEEDLRTRGHDVAAHEVSLEYVFTSRAADTLIPVWRVLLEKVDVITGIDSIWRETSPAGSERDCSFFNALTGEESTPSSGTDPAGQRQTHHQLKPPPTGPGLQRPA